MACYGKPWNLELRFGEFYVICAFLIQRMSHWQVADRQSFSTLVQLIDKEIERREVPQRILRIPAVILLTRTTVMCHRFLAL
jgi:hypothetical protein